jgi:hypothetical protein
MASSKGEEAAGFRRLLDSPLLLRHRLHLPSLRPPPALPWLAGMRCKPAAESAMCACSSQDRGRVSVTGSYKRRR